MAIIRRVKAHAKINLFLEITGKRADGYHTLSTVFQSISLADELTLKAATPHPYPLSPLRGERGGPTCRQAGVRGVELTCSDPSLPTGGENLVVRAALHLKDTLNELRGVKIHLQKNVPKGEGCG